MIERTAETYDLDPVRELNEAEAEQLADCVDLFSYFCDTSPFEDAVAYFKAFTDAELHVLEHPVAADLDKCVGLAVSMINRILTLKEVVQALERRGMDLSDAAKEDVATLTSISLPLLDVLARPKDVRLYPSGLMLLGVQQTPVLLSSCLSRCMAAGERTVWRLAQDLSMVLRNACSFIRHLGAEVPIGSPVVSPLSEDPESLTITPLPIDDAAFIEQLIRSPLPPTDEESQAHSQQDVDPTPPQPMNVYRRRSTQDANAEYAREIPAARPQLDGLIKSLAADSVHFLASWAAALDAERHREDLERLRSALAAIVGLFQLAVAESALAGTRLPDTYPPDARTLSSLAKDDASRPQLVALGHVTAASILAEQAEHLSAPRLLNASGGSEPVLLIDPCVVRDLLTLSDTVAGSLHSQCLTTRSAVERSAECLAAGRMLSALVYALAACRSDDSIDASLRQAAHEVMEDCIAGHIPEVCCAPFASLLIQIYNRG